MQYIQLQGQVAAGLDLPLEGSYNLFIDTSDNSIKAKDFEGNLTGGGGLSLIEVTREEVGQLVLSASLTPGAFYKITGVASASFYDDRQWSYTAYGNEIQDGGTTIILQAATDKTLSKKGVGLFYVPNYENPQVPTAPPDYNYLVWDSTSRLEFSSSFGVFDHDEYVNLYANGSSSLSYLRANIGASSITLEAPDDSDFFTNTDNYPMSIVGYDSNAWAGIVDFYDRASYNVGDCVIWGGRVWTNRSGSVGYKTGGWPLEQLTLNEEDWTKVPFNETNYTIVADLIEYEFEWDNISYRKGANNVEVRCDAILMLDYWGYNMIKYFPWGHYGIQNISISNSYLDAFVNYPHDAQADQIKFADYGGFNAHYWGRETEIYNINGDTNAHMVSLNLGYRTRINDITLGQRAYISDIYTYDNDNGYTALYEIALGIDAAIDDDYDPIYMYVDSYMGNLILENNANITDINLYKGSRIKDSKLGIDSYIKGIALNDYADFRQVELGNSSYIQYINADVSSCFKRVKLGIDSYIEYVGIGVNGYFKHVEMADQSSIYCNIIGDYAYFQYINLGISSEIYATNQISGSSNFEYINVGVDSNIYDIYLGIDCSFNHITVASDSTISIINASGATNAYIRHLDIGTLVSFGGITMEDGSYIRRMDIGNDSEVGSILLTGGTSISDFSISNDAGFGGLDILASSSLSNFEIGQNSGFCCREITSSMSDITISRGFNNFNANVFEVTGSTNTSYTPVDYQNAGSTLDNSKSFHLIDISGQSTTLSWYLDDGIYEGQEVTFLLKNDGTADINSTDVWIFLNTLRSATGNLQTSYPWYPFEKDTAQNTWRNTAKAIWIDGAWNVDNSMYD
jgi:hypothetical protein